MGSVMGSAMGSVLGLISTCHEVGSVVQIVTFCIKIVKWQSVSQKGWVYVELPGQLKNGDPKLKPGL